MAVARPIRFDEVDMSSYAEFLAEAEVTDDEIALIRQLFTEVLDGRNSSVTDGVRRALGRPPRDFSIFARDAHAAGLWTASTGVDA